MECQQCSLHVTFARRKQPGPQGGLSIDELTFLLRVTGSPPIPQLAVLALKRHSAS